MFLYSYEYNDIKKYIHIYHVFLSVSVMKRKKAECSSEEVSPLIGDVLDLFTKYSVNVLTILREC